MACFWIWFGVFLMDARLKEFMGLLSIYRLNQFSFSVSHISVLERFLLILGYSMAAVPCALPHQPWRLTLV